MDSLTQLALGAAVGETILGRKVGNRAVLWGGLCGTLPDLDVFIPLGGVVEDFTYHRSFSHSLFVLALLTPLLVWLILKIHPRTAQYRRGWYWLVGLVFATHVLLDSFTVYGTQIFWPIPVSMTWSTIFIIDPLYTLPLLVGVICALVMTRPRGHRINTIALALSTGYLAWSVAAKLYVEDTVRDALARQGVVYERLLTTPAPFNTVLWRVLVMDGDGYYEGYYSLLDGKPNLTLIHYPSETNLLAGIEDHWPVARLQWFTKGFYSVSQRDDDVVITDLRMGMEPDYVFGFKVAELANPHPRPVTVERVSPLRSTERLPWVWERIWTAEPTMPYFRSRGSKE